VLHFKWKTVFDVKNIDLHFYVLEATMEEETPKIEKNERSILSFFRRRKLLF
jgi:hypothetical protein